MSLQKAFLLLTLILVVAVVGLRVYPTGVPQARGTSAPIGTPVKLKAPLGLPPVPIPADNPPTAETLAIHLRLPNQPAVS